MSDPTPIRGAVVNPVNPNVGIGLQIATLIVVIVLLVLELT